MKTPRPTRRAKTNAIQVTPEGERAVLPTTPIDYEITPRGQGEFLPTKGQFRKGDDSRRHEFSLEECQRGGVAGYSAATESLLRRFPNADPHFLMCAITGAKPWYTLPRFQAQAAA